MKQYLICFEFRGDIPNDMYVKFYTYIKKISSKSMHVFNGTYIIDTDVPKEDIQAELLKLALCDEMKQADAKLFYFIIEISDRRDDVTGFTFNSFWEFFK